MRCRYWAAAHPAEHDVAGRQGAAILDGCDSAELAALDLALHGEAARTELHALPQLEAGDGMGAQDMVRYG
jgi:hypothetical protein